MNRSQQILAVLLCFVAALGAALWGSNWKNRAQKLAEADPMLGELASLATRVEELSSRLDQLNERVDNLPASSVQKPGFVAPEYELQVEVAAKRELEWQRDPSWTPIDRDAMASAVHAELRRVRTPDDWEKTARAWLTIGLIDDHYDLFAMESTLRVVGNRAWYSAQDQQIYVRDDLDASELSNRRLLANALGAALADQNLRAQNLPLYLGNNDDAVLAARVLAEGDPATLAEALVDPAEMLLAGGGTGLAVGDAEALARVPDYLRARRQFASVFGQDFVAALQQDGESGWAGVDAAYARPPSSTAEVLHPDLYFQGWAPGVIDWDVPLWYGAELLADNVVGEFALGEMLAALVDPSMAMEAAIGWQSDRYQVYAGEEGGDVLVWQLDWQSSADTQEAFDAFAARYEAWYGMEGEPVAESEADRAVMRWEDGMSRLELAITGPQSLLIVDAPSAQFEALRDSVPAPSAGSEEGPEQEDGAAKTNESAAQEQGLVPDEADFEAAAEGESEPSRQDPES